MSRSKAFLCAGLILVGFSAPATSKAFALSVGGDFWNENFGNGVGGNIYPQWHIAYGLSPELQIGFHWTKVDVAGATANIAYVPVMIGLRFDLSEVVPLGIIAPFVAAHIGYAGIQEWGNGSIGGGSNNLGYSFNAGTNFHLGPVGLGVQGGYDIVSNSSGNVNIGSVDLILQF
jgi:hypothetical protein